MMDVPIYAIYRFKLSIQTEIFPTEGSYPLPLSL